MPLLVSDKKNKFTRGKTIGPGQVDPTMFIWFKYKSVAENYEISSYNPCLWVLEINKQDKTISGVNLNYLDNGTMKIIETLDEGIGYKQRGFKVKVQGGTWTKITAYNSYRTYKMKNMKGIKILDWKEK